MARVPVMVQLADAAGNALAGVSCRVKNRATLADVSLYAAETGPAAAANPMVTDALGRVVAWADRAPFRIDYSGGALTAFSEYRDLGPSSDAGLDAGMFATGSIPSTAIAGGVGGAPVGMLADWAPDGDPSDTNWLLADGRAVSRTTYAALFALLQPSKGTVTITLANPGVITSAVAHGLRVGDPVIFTTTGGLPTGLVAGTVYYVLSVPTTTTLTVSATLGGAAVATSVGQSGVHTMTRACPFGVGDGATTFNLPDLRGRVAVGQKDMRTAAGAASGRIDNQLSVVPGGSGGVDVVTLTAAQIPSHSHTHVVGNAGGGGTTGDTSILGGSIYSSTSTEAFTGLGLPGGGGAHSNTPPFLILNAIIKVL